nr:hypothetical protein [Tanacetum cinerariifolium]
RKDSNTPGKKVPKKVLRYFSIIPRLQRLYKSSHTAKEMIWHATGKCTDPSKMQHPVDGRAWKNFNTNPKFPGKDINVYLRPLIEDLKVLWDRKGVETIDVTSGQKFNMRTMVLWTINDFPARSSLSGLDQGGRYLCDLEIIYPPALFDIMIHLVIHLPLEALEGGLIRPRWKFPFKRYMKKLKGYVRNKAKPEGLIAKGFVTEEALTFRRKVKRLVLINNMTQIDTRAESFKDDQYILVTQVKQVFYLEDKAKPYWRVVELINHKKFFDGGVIVVEDDPDIIHFDNSSDLPLSTSLNDLDNATLHIDGQSTEVDLPPDIIDVVDEDNDITDDEDALPHDLVDSDNKDLINVDDDCVDKISADVVRSYGGDSGGKGKQKPNLSGRAAGRLNTPDRTRNLSLKEITDTKGPVPIPFELRDKQIVMPRGDHAAHWSSYIREDIRGVPLYYPSWLKVPKERKAAVITDIGEHCRAAQNQQNRAKSTVISRQGSRSLARLRVEMEEMRRLEATGTYTDDEINRLARGGKQRGNILGVGRVLLARATASPSTPVHESTLNSLHKKVNFKMSLFKSDSKYSDMFSQFESDGASGSGGCGDDEEGADHQDDEDEDGDT